MANRRESLRGVYTPAMKDIADMDDSDERRVDHEATLQLKINRGRREAAEAATLKYAETLQPGNGARIVAATVLGNRALRS